MASVCISHCVKDTSVPIRATFVNLHKWPESEVEFVKRVNNSNTRFGGSHGHPKGVDIFSCRQMYLRSYKFSREKVGVAQKTLKYFNKIKEKVVFVVRNNFNFKTKYRVLGRAKDVASAAFSIFKSFLLSCSAKLDRCAS